MERFQPQAELRKIDVSGIVELPPLPEISSDNYDADEETENSSDFGSADGKLPSSTMETELFLKHFAKRMGHANYSAFNKWKKVWMVRLLQKQHQSSIQGQNCLKQLPGGPLHWQTAVGDYLATFENCLRLENFNNAEWIH